MILILKNYLLPSATQDQIALDIVYKHFLTLESEK